MDSLTCSASPESGQQWQAALQQSYVPMDCSITTTRKFFGRIRTRDMPLFSMSEVNSDPHRVTRSRSHISDSAPPLYYLNLQLHGQTMVRQADREIAVTGGDLVAIDTQKPYEIESFDTFGLLCFSVPKSIMQPLLLNRHDLGAAHIPGSAGFARTLQTLAADLYDGHISRYQDHRFAGSILRMLALAFDQAQTGGLQRSRAHDELYRAVLGFIEQHLAECDLGVKLVCEHFRISSRYLHKLFECTSETFHQYVLRRRVEQCRDQICDLGARGGNIAQIAFNWGFADLSTFYRAFKRITGESPRNLQRSALLPN